jgi:hypothetical protein
VVGACGAFVAVFRNHAEIVLTHSNRETTESERKRHCCRRDSQLSNSRAKIGFKLPLFTYGGQSRRGEEESERCGAARDRESTQR